MELESRVLAFTGPQGPSLRGTQRHPAYRYEQHVCFHTGIPSRVLGSIRCSTVFNHWKNYSTPPGLAWDALALVLSAPLGAVKAFSVFL